MKNKIEKITAREIIDSRGMPTIEASVILSNKIKGTASVPSGASCGSYEAHEKRDGDTNRYFGKGVLNAVENVNGCISNELQGQNFGQRSTDNALIKLDGSKNKKVLGANAILSVSLAHAKARASERSLPLYRYIGGIFASKMPIPMMNILNGGAHAENNLDIQEFMIVPTGFDSFDKALQAGCEIYRELKKILASKGYATGVGDEGGFAPNLSSEDEAIELIIEAINSSNYDTSSVKIALDVASSEWYNGSVYTLPKSQKSYTSEELIDRFRHLISKYPIISIEDPLAETDYLGWKKITKELSNKVMLVGDDLFVTNSERLSKGISDKMANSILIKPNQVGTLTETLDVIELAKEAGYNTIISHRSGETDDTYIADIAVGTNAGFIKTGAPSRMERVAKYNRLLEIEDEIYRA